MRKKTIHHYGALFIFYLIYSGLFVGLSLIFDQPESNADFIIIYRFFVLFMIQVGIYLISFIYGLYFQKKNRLTWLNILMSAMFVFIIQVIVYWPLWKPDLLHYDLDTQYLLRQSGLQALCFFVGCASIRLKAYFKLVKQKNNQ
ncbi:hypothetical protein [Paenibacillus sp. S150]|uniref:hypothetical protein n=1 Tax=Paenibacillus sp. S150 TaxID=2749826 RepID=UPI001C582DEE|nr:hypothetical protein [Paenibacillus sp. S150]MBW4080277.1 hypothetical protein [Paenibacillus sp. S150]